MNTANALNLLLAIALVLMSAKLYFTSTFVIGGDDGPTAIWLSSKLQAESPEPASRDFHEGHTLPEAPAKPASASDFALAALGADASALPVPKTDAVTTATPSTKKEEAATDSRAIKPSDVNNKFTNNPFTNFTGKGTASAR